MFLLAMTRTFDNPHRDLEYGSWPLANTDKEIFEETFATSSAHKAQLLAWNRTSFSRLSGVRLGSPCLEDHSVHVRIRVS